MLCFMQFTFDPEILRELCRDEWLKIYDTDYVDALIQQVGQERPLVASATLLSTLRQDCAKLRPFCRTDHHARERGR